MYGSHRSCVRYGSTGAAGVTGGTGQHVVFIEALLGKISFSDMIPFSVGEVRSYTYVIVLLTNLD